MMLSQAFFFEVLVMLRRLKLNLPIDSSTMARLSYQLTMNNQLLKSEFGLFQTTFVVAHQY